MHVADTLSRAQLQGDKEDEDMAENLEVMVHLLVRNIPVSLDRKEEIRIATAEDPQMQQLYQAVTSGWPERRCRAPYTTAGNSKAKFIMQRGSGYFEDASSSRKGSRC